MEAGKNKTKRVASYRLLLYITTGRCYVNTEWKALMIFAPKYKIAAAASPAQSRHHWGNTQQL